MRYHRSLFSLITALVIFSFLPVIGILFIIGPFILGFPRIIQPFFFMSFFTGVLLLGFFAYLLKKSSVIKSIDIEDQGIFINYINRRIKLDGITRIEYTSKYGGGAVSDDLNIFYSGGKVAITGLFFIDNFKGLIKELQQKTGLKVENAEKLKID